MKSALVIGNLDSIHTINFINSILVNNRTVDEICLFSTDSNGSYKRKKEYIDYYAKKNIQVVSTDLGFQKNKILRRVSYTIKKTTALYKILRKNKYDYCFELYCSEYSAMWGSLFSKRFEKLIPVFWGGDVLRNNKLNDVFFKKMLFSAYKIIMPNINCLKTFDQKTNYRYSDKTVVIQYPQKMVPSLKETEANVETNECKMKFHLPLDKKIVICGHTATRAENYIDMIRSLEKCTDVVLGGCYFVFMMTYSPEEYFSYQREVSEVLEKSKLNGIVLKEFMPYEEILKLHFASDIHITAIKTDAFSCFLQEELFSGSILLYGRWLKYYELENDNFFAVPFDKIDRIADVFSDVINNFEDYKNRTKRNRKGIIDLASEEAILKEWNQYVFK